MKVRALVIAFLLAAAGGAWAGPPFVTDDPEPVELHHWEVYISSMLLHDAAGTSGTLPHVEINYGAVPNLQVHMIVPCAFDQPNGAGTARGLGDTELGLKWRFLQATSGRPMVGVFPLLEVPTGNARRGLESGHLQVFLPVWLQKSWGPWTGYGGGGYFVNPGAGNRDYWLAGGEAQRDLSSHLTLGGELFGTSPQSDGAAGQLNFNLGGQYNFDDGHHLLFSAGRGLRGDVKFMDYVGFQWTFGPGG
jgi:hypothetical protein